MLKFIKSLLINGALTMNALENKLIKNTDVENKSNNDPMIIEKDHHISLINEMRRGEKNQEYVDYFYKLLDKADKVVINEELVKRVGNLDQETFELLTGQAGMIDPVTGKVIEGTVEQGTDMLREYLESGGDKNKVARVVKLNAHYKLIRDIKVKYAEEDYFSDDSSNINFYPDDLISDIKKQLDFIRLREFNESEIILEFWYRSINLFDNDFIKQLTKIDHLYNRNVETYELEEYLDTYIYEGSTVVVYRGKDLTKIE